MAPTSGTEQDLIHQPWICKCDICKRGRAQISWGYGQRGVHGPVGQLNYPLSSAQLTNAWLIIQGLNVRVGPKRGLTIYTEPYIKEEDLEQIWSRILAPIIDSTIPPQNIMRDEKIVQEQVERSIYPPIEITL
jgi:hypothetical protein